MASFFSNQHRENSVLDLAWQFLYMGWLEVWRAKVESLDADEMLMRSCQTKEIGFKKYMMEHCMTRIRCYSRDQFGKRMLIKY